LQRYTKERRLLLNSSEHLSTLKALEKLAETLNVPVKELFDFSEVE
jgi:hypothetical protein